MPNNLKFVLKFMENHKFMLRVHFAPRNRPSKYKFRTFIVCSSSRNLPSKRKDPTHDIKVLDIIAVWGIFMNNLMFSRILNTFTHIKK